MLQTIEILSIIISFSSDSNNLICILFWSDIVGRTSPVFLGIANAVCCVDGCTMNVYCCYSIGAVSKTVGFSGFIGVYLYIFATVWYIGLIKWLFPAPPPPVINR